MKLNLASGTDLRPPPWVNLDVVAQWPTSPTGIAYPPCDVLWDATKDGGRIPFPDASADEVYAGYLLLHIPPVHHAPVLAEILRVLQPGAPALFGEVDMRLAMERWLRDPFGKACSELIWGEQGDVHGEQLACYDKHCWGFTEEKLRGVLSAAGFIDFERIRVHHPDVWYELTLRCRK